MQTDLRNLFDELKRRRVFCVAIACVVVAVAVLQGADVLAAALALHANPRRGRPMGEARGWFERVLGVEPENIEARLHLARLDAAERNVEGLRRHSDFFERVVPDSERSIEVSATYAFAAGDTARQRGVAERLQVWPWWAYAYAASAAARYAPASASAILATQPAGYDYLDAMVPQLHMATGRYDAVRDFIRARCDTREGALHRGRRATRRPPGRSSRTAV